MPMNRTLEAMLTHRVARRSTSDAQLRQLAVEDLNKNPPRPTPTALSPTTASAPSCAPCAALIGTNKVRRARRS